jgi:hypothetical protein
VPGRPNELLARELAQRLGDFGRVSIAHARDGADPEHLSDHRSIREQSLALGRQRVETRGDQRLDGPGQWELRAGAESPSVRLGDEQLLVAEQAQELLHVERVAFRPLHYRRAEIFRNRRRVQQARHEIGCLGVGQRREIDAVGVVQAGGERGVAVEQLRPGRADEEQRHALDLVGEVLEEGEHGFVRPVDVLEHEHRRRLFGHCLEERPPGGKELFPLRLRRRVDADERQQALPQPFAIGPSASTAPSFVVAVSWSSVSRIPVWALTISPSAQNVIPSPYGRHRPCRQVSRGSRSCA